MTSPCAMAAAWAPLTFHYVRFAVQCVLLGLLATLAKDSFFYAWGDEIAGVIAGLMKENFGAVDRVEVPKEVAMSR